MGYTNVIPSWMLEEILKEQVDQAKKQKTVGLTARIITGSVEYFKELNPAEWKKPIWKIGCETMNQLESEQFILSKGFTVAHS